MDKAIALTLNLQLCLAHYCDTHGPTPLMVTEGLPAGCSVCFDESVVPSLSPGPQTNASPSGEPRHATVIVTEALRELNLTRSASVPASEQDTAQRNSLLRSSTAATAAGFNSPVLDTPPESPRPMFQQPQRDSSYRRTYDDTVTRKQGPCDNCAMTLPRRQANKGASSNDYLAGGPILRTRAPAERVLGPVCQTSPPTSRSSSDTDGEQHAPRKARRRRVAPPASSRTTSCSTESASSGRPQTHLHYVNYTSTHEPVLPNSFSLLRASCLRALSFEMLPRAPTTAQPVTSPLNSPPSFITNQSAGSAASGGPIFFGDALAGYTTAYIFRIPDVHARGHKRVYAFLALSTHKERLAMKTFAIISAAFRELALWIQQLAEAEAERAASSSPVSGSLYGFNAGGGYAQPRRSPSTLTSVDRGESSFLTGGSGFTRRMGGGGVSYAPKARGLAELVGQPDFFIELHRRFVQLEFEVGVALNS